jgi:hypothetical protein
MATGSRQEDASNQESRASFLFNRNGKSFEAYCSTTAGVSSPGTSERSKTKLIWLAQARRRKRDVAVSSAQRVQNEKQFRNKVAGSSRPLLPGVYTVPPIVAE